MSPSTALEIAVPEVVLAEVRRKSAEVEFESFRDTFVEHFADALATEVYLLADPDEDDRNWVVFEAILPSTSSLDEVQRRKARFRSALSSSRRHISWPICSLGIRFAKKN